MRVITGKAKGHKLRAPKGLNTRPTTDRVKESIFSIIGDISPDSLVLDLFSGTGSIGIEFLSRGAKLCYFVDMDATSIKAIEENLKKTKLYEQAHIHKNKVDMAIDYLSNKDISFNYIFLDPPYEKGLIESSLEKIADAAILDQEGLVIAEHENNIVLLDKIHNLFRVSSRQYGGTTISFYKLGEIR